MYCLRNCRILSQYLCQMIRDIICIIRYVPKRICDRCQLSCRIISIRSNISIKIFFPEDFSHKVIDIFHLLIFFIHQSSHLSKYIITVNKFFSIAVCIRSYISKCIIRIMFCSFIRVQDCQQIVCSFFIFIRS